MNNNLISGICFSAAAVWSSFSFGITSNSLTDGMGGIPFESTAYIYWNNLTGKNIKLVREHGYQIVYHDGPKDIAPEQRAGYDIHSTGDDNTTAKIVSSHPRFGVTYTYQATKEQMLTTGDDLVYEIEPGYRFHMRFWSGVPDGTKAIISLVASFAIQSVKGAGSADLGNIELSGLDSMAAYDNGEAHAYIDIDGSEKWIGSRQAYKPNYPLWKGLGPEQVTELFSSKTTRIDQIGEKYIVILTMGAFGKIHNQSMIIQKLQAQLPTGSDGSSVATIMTVDQYEQIRSSLSANKDDLASIINKLKDDGWPVSNVDDLKKIVLPASLKDQGLPEKPDNIDLFDPQHFCKPGTTDQILIADGSLVCKDGLNVPGSYIETCVPLDFAYDGDTLTALCMDSSADQNFKPTTIRYKNSCNPGTTVNNNNGKLQCDQPAPVPGSYLQSCKDISFDQGVLKASCSDGLNYYPTSLSYADCGNEGTVSNIESKLTCD